MRWENGEEEGESLGKEGGRDEGREGQIWKGKGGNGRGMKDIVGCFLA